MTTHQFLTWAVPFFAVMTTIGAALSIARLFSRRRAEQQGQLSRQPGSDLSGSGFQRTNQKYQLKYRVHQLAMLAAALGAAIASAILVFTH
jgi:hypothetical protein